MTSKDRLQIVPDLPIDIPCPPCKPPKAPNPSNCDCESCVHVKSSRTSLACSKCYAAEQLNAFARLEAWLAEDGRRYVYRIDRVCGFCVVLGKGTKTTFALESGDAKAPGLAATILAALEKAGEVKL